MQIIDGARAGGLFSTRVERQQWLPSVVVLTVHRPFAHALHRASFTCSLSREGLGTRPDG